MSDEDELNYAEDEKEIESELKSIKDTNECN